MTQMILMGGGIFVSVLLLLYLGYQGSQHLIDRYQSSMNETANVGLAELFIFIDPSRLYLLNLVAMFISFFIIWFVAGHWGPAIIGGSLMAFFPKAVYQFLRKQRQDKFMLELPDALNSMSSMMRAGTSTSVAMEMLVAESTGPIRQEFGLLLKEIRVGVDFEDALENMAERMPMDDFKMVVAGMKISREVGGSLAEVLSRLAETIRRKLELEGKINALTAMGKAQGYVMALLPFALGVILFQMEPQAMAKLFDTAWGWAACAVIVVLELQGFFFIKKIVTIDV